MSLLGDAAIVMWMDIAPEIAPEFEDWHSREHIFERLRIPGFLRGSRWKALAGSSYFIMYEVRSLDTVTSSAYAERLNNPTPWSRKIFAHFRNMTRSPCRPAGGFGAGLGAALLTVRFSPQQGEEGRLRDWVVGAVLPELALRPGIVSAHLLAAERQPAQHQTEEQRLRGGDASADWVLLVAGDDADRISSLPERELRDQVLAEHGASPRQTAATYRFALALTDIDLCSPDRASASGLP